MTVPAKPPPCYMFPPTHLVILSIWPASKLIRFVVSMFASRAPAACDSRFPVLLFFGRKTLSEANRRVGCMADIESS